MKRLTIFCLICLGAFVLATSCSGKASGTIIILLRHAEKDTGADPGLSAAGKTRAARLALRFKAYNPDAFYSTATKRTRQTLAPWAARAGKEVLTYNAAQQEHFAKELKDANGKTIVVVGHSNTIPALANLILGRNTYTDIPESDFGRVWIITIKDDKASAKVETY